MPETNANRLNYRLQRHRDCKEEAKDQRKILGVNQMFNSRSISLPQYGSTARPNSLVPTFEGMFRRAADRVRDFAANAGARTEKLVGDMKAIGIALAVIGTPLLLAAAWQADSPRPVAGTNPLAQTVSNF